MTDAEPGTPGIRDLLRKSLHFSPLAVASVVSMANSFAIALAFAHLANPASYGTYQLAFAIAGVAGIFALSGSSTAAVRAAAQGRAAAFSLFVARLPYAAGTAAALLAGAVVLALTGRGALAAALAALAITLPIFLGADVYPAQLIGLRRLKAYLSFQVIVQVSTAALVVVAVAWLPTRPWVAVLAVAGTTGVLQFAAMLRTRRASVATADDRRYARNLSGLSILTTLDAQLDLLVTGALLGAREAGILAVARTLPLIPRRLWDVGYQPFFVAISAREPRLAYGLVKRYRVPLTAAFAVVCVIGIAAAPWLIPGLFGHEYQGAVLVTQLLLLGNIVRAAALLDELFIKAVGDMRRLGIIYLVLPVTSILLLPPLVWTMGLVGVGVEALVAAAVYGILVVVLASRSARLGKSQ